MDHSGRHCIHPNEMDSFFVERLKETSQQAQARAFPRGACVLQCSLRVLVYRNLLSKSVSGHEEEVRILIRSRKYRPRGAFLRP